MAVPSPAEADAVAVRVRLVADMLLQKAREVESKGNAGAAVSLQESAADLHRSVSLLLDLTRHVHETPLPLRRDSDASISSMNSDSLTQDASSRAPVSVSIRDLVTRLGRVDILLSKKSDEMKQKGNESATNALLQSALTVRQAVQHIGERQQMTRALVVTTRALREQLLELSRVVLQVEDVNGEMALEEGLIQQALESANELASLRDIIQNVMGHVPRKDVLRSTLLAGLAVEAEMTPTPSSNDTQVRELTEKCEELMKRVDELQIQYEHDLREAKESSFVIQSQRDNLEIAFRELEGKSNECECKLHSVESTLVEERRAYEAIQKELVDMEENYRALNELANSWKNQLTEQQKSLQDLQELRERDRQAYEGEVELLQKQLQERERDLQVSREALRGFEFQEEAIKSELGGVPYVEKIRELQHEIEVLQASHDAVVAERESAHLAREEMLHRLNLLRNELEPRLEQAVRAKEAADEIVLDQTKRIEDLSRKLDVAEEALSDSKIEISRQNEAIGGVQTESARWKRALLSLLRQLGLELPPSPQELSFDEIVKLLCDWCERLVIDLREAREAHAALQSKNEVDMAQKTRAEEELLAMKNTTDRLQATISELTDKNNSLEAQLKVSDTASVAVGVQTKELETMRAKLRNVELEFERYRVRSHAALRKMEKRSELLNNMRRENADLQHSSAALKQELKATITKEENLACRLNETIHTMLMNCEESSQKAEEMSARLEALKGEVTAAIESREHFRLVCCSLEATVAKLQSEKEDLVTAKNELHEQVLALKEEEVVEIKKRLQDEQDRNAQLIRQLSALNEVVSARTDTTSDLESHVRVLSEELDAAKKAADAACDDRTTHQEVQQMLELKTTELQALVDRMEDELISIKRELEAAHASQRETSRNMQAAAERTNEIATKEIQLGEKLKTAEAENQEMAKRVLELEQVKLTLEREIDQLRDKLALRESDGSRLPTASNSEPSTNSTEVPAFRNERQTSVSDHPGEICDALLSPQQIKESEKALLAQDMDEPTIAHERQPENRGAESYCGSSDLRTDVLEESERFLQETEKKKRSALAASYTQKAASVVRELQENLDKYSSIFRDACALREQDGDLLVKSELIELNQPLTSEQSKFHVQGESLSQLTEAPPEYEEYLTLKSGVVVKAGSTFSLPVYCDKVGWRVEWKFAVKEDGADVGYKLSLETSSDGTRQREVIVAPSRVKEMAGVYESPYTKSESVATALVFEWDNSFSWLNEKTLDYHVCVFEPLSEFKKNLRIKERDYRSRLKTIDERIALLDGEKQQREILLRALDHFEQCRLEKDEHLAVFQRRKEVIQTTKLELQSQMETAKHKLGLLVRELDDLATSEETVVDAWGMLQSERDDVDMTLHISANDHLEKLMESLKTQKETLLEQLGQVEKELQSDALQ